MHAKPTTTIIVASKIYVGLTYLCDICDISRPLSYILYKWIMLFGR